MLIPNDVQVAERMATFKQNVELDASIFFANHKADGPDPIASAIKFRELSMAVGMTDPVEGILRALWLLTQPEDYKRTVSARARQMIAADESGVVN